MLGFTAEVVEKSGVSISFFSSIKIVLVVKRISTSFCMCFSILVLIMGRNRFCNKSITMVDGAAMVATLSSREKSIVCLKRVRKLARDTSFSISVRIMFQRAGNCGCIIMATVAMWI